MQRSFTVCTTFSNKFLRGAAFQISKECLRVAACKAIKHSRVQHVSGKCLRSEVREVNKRLGVQHVRQTSTLGCSMSDQPALRGAACQQEM
eukprot:1155310-Pelagomonas_calceolata.AAC.10